MAFVFIKSANRRVISVPPNKYHPSYSEKHHALALLFLKFKQTNRNISQLQNFHLFGPS